MEQNPVQLRKIAKRIARQVIPVKSTNPHDRCSVYLIWLDGCTKGDSPYGFYVGETAKEIGERFMQHKGGGRLSNSEVYRWGRWPMRKATRHLAALTRAEARRVEGLLIRELKQAGLPNVLGGDLGLPIGGPRARVDAREG